MATIRRLERGGEYWIDFRYRGRRIRRRSPVQTKRGAEAFERTVRHEIGADEEAGRDPFAGPPPKFAEFVERWMREYVVVHNRASGQREKESCLRNHLLPTFGSLAIDAIGAREVSSFVAALVARGLAPKSINNILSVLRASLTAARELRLLREVPRIKQLRVPEQPYQVLTEVEAARLLAATRPGFWRAFVTLLLDTGVRFSEGAALRWVDVTLKGPCASASVSRGAVRGIIGATKTGRVRTVPLTSRVVKLLDELPRDHELIFHTLGGEPIRSEWTLTYLHRMCDRAGVKRVGWHALRHTCATLACQRGMPLRNVQALLGHTTLQMTSRYAHATDADLQRWMRHCFEKVPLPDWFGHQVATNGRSGPPEADTAAVPIAV